MIVGGVCLWRERLAWKRCCDCDAFISLRRSEAVERVSLCGNLWLRWIISTSRFLKLLYKPIFPWKPEFAFQNMFLGFSFVKAIVPLNQTSLFGQITPLSRLIR